MERGQVTSRPSGLAGGLRSLASPENNTKWLHVTKITIQYSILAHSSNLDDVEATDKLAVDVQLRIGGPVGEGLQALSHFVVAQDVEVAKFGTGV